MTVTLYHHPFSRAANVVWMLEEVGVDYQLEFVDLFAGAHKKPEFLALNPMGKVPVLTDGEAVLSESAAIGLYLADRYSSGKLAPSLDDPARARYLRWSLFAPSVIEPGAMAKLEGWTFKHTQAGWGRYETMLDVMETAVSDGFLLGKSFSMADMIFGGTVRYMLQFKMIDARPSLVAYAERLAERPALQKSMEINGAIIVERGLGK